MTRRWYWETSAQSTVSKNAKTTGITAIIVFVMVLSLFVISIRGSSEFLITGQFHDQNCPAIYENIVVWQDYRNGNWDIYGYNLSTNQEFQITTDLDDQYYPAIYQDFVVWTDSRNGNGDIYGYNLSTKSEFKIATSADHQFYPAIYEDLVVWMETKNNKNNIYAHNLSTRQGFLIYANANAQGTPAIYGNIVVWTDERNGNLDIYGYNLSTKSEFRITSVPSDQRYPAIYGNIVVWTDERNGNWDIYGYNLSTQEEFQITTDPSSQWGPAIYGDFVAWIDFEGIYIYNLSRREGFQITAIVYTISEGIGHIGDPPKIYDETIVWEDHRHGNWDIYGYNLPSTPIISYFTVSIAVQNVYGIPISGASVILGPYPVATTDASGIAVISNVESGTYFLKASAPGYQEKIQPVTITGNQTVDIILHSIPTVTITVRSTSGKAISGATVTMTGPSTYTNTTDAQGKVVFLNVEKDTYTLTVSAVDYQENIQTVTITKTVTIPVVLVSNISVTITAKEISGKAISGATVTMTGPSTYTNTTDAQGKVVFLNVEKDTYTLTVSAVDYQENIQTVTITKTVTIPVVLVTELGHVHGTIYWEGTVPKPAKNVTVRIYDQETNELVEIEITDSQGKFDAEVPKDGIYYIVVEDFTEQRKTGIVPMDSSLTGAFAIMIDSQCYVSGIVVDKFGEGVTGARVTIKDISDQEIADGITDDLGQFNIKVTPGTYYVEITASGYETYKSDIFTVFSQYSDLGSLALKEPRFRVTDVILVMTIICIISLYILQRSRIAPFIEEHSIPIILVISILMIFTLTRDEEDLRMALISIFGGIIAAIIISLATAKKSQKPRVEDHRFEPYKYER